MDGLHFIHPGFLATAAAVAVPILIHLLFRQKARRVEIGSLHFLRVALRDNARRRKIRRWVLLALRAAGALLLALLFARPYWNAPGTAGKEREVALVIDRSASMGAGPADKSPFARARQAAERVLRDQPDGTTVHLAYADAADVEPIPGHRLDPSAGPGFAATDHGKALAWARDVMVQSPRPSRRVYLLTDLQRSGMDRASLDGRFPGDVALEVVDVGRKLARNLAIDDARAGRTDLRPDVPALVTARVYNAGPFAARGVKVRLSIEGPETAARDLTLDIEGGERRVARFEVPLKTPGLYQGFVEVAGEDELPFDDRRWLAFEARRADRVLLVDGEPGASAFGDETYYLETALRLRLPGEGAKGKQESSTPYEPGRVAWGGSLPDLSPYRVVALCNVADVPQAEADKLAAFVVAGGDLLIFTGEKVKPEGYETLGRAGLLPATIGPPAEVGAYRFAAWEKDHPLLRPFADPQYGDLRTLKLRRITRLTPKPGAKVLASATGGKPLLVEGAKGEGRVLVLAAPADNEWGDWAVRRLYLPLIHQMMGYLTGRLPEDGPIRSAASGSGPGRAPGVERSGGAVIVRNPDPGESEIDRATVADFRKAYDLPAAEAKPEGDDDGRPALPDGSQRPDELWRALAWALLVVLVVETFVANRTRA